MSSKVLIMSRLAKTVARVRDVVQGHILQIPQPLLFRYVELAILGCLFLMFPLGYLESFRWPLPPPKATHGILKALVIVLGLLVFYSRSVLKNHQPLGEKIVSTLFLASFVLSSLFSLVPNTSLLFLWYPFIGWTVLYTFSSIRFTKTHFSILLSMMILLITATFVFAFFSLMFRYEVDNIYYFLFQTERARLLLNELRVSGKYVSLGPYIFLYPACMIFLVQLKSSFSRKMLSALVFVMVVLTAVISNNRIDILVVLLQSIAILWLLPRRTAVVLTLLAIPVIYLGLVTSQNYFGYNLIERVFRPHVTRDKETVEMRFVYWQNALLNFRHHPILGTGPNSYNDVTDFPLRRYYDAGLKQYTVRPDVGIGIHNIFIERLADTGIIGFAAFILLLAYFIKTDFLRYFQYSGERRKQYVLLALSSWSWILYGVTDNGYGAQGFVTFLFLRGVLKHV